MHMVEEAEHKTVAFDVYMTYSGRYLTRALGVFHGTFHTWGWGIVGMMVGLRKNGLLPKPRTMLNILKELGSAVWNVAPFMFRALLPGYNPRQEREPQWYEDWLIGHATLNKNDPLPLVDTTDPEMPVPFSKVA